MEPKPTPGEPPPGASMALGNGNTPKTYCWYMDILRDRVAKDQRVGPTILARIVKRHPKTISNVWHKGWTGSDKKPLAWAPPLKSVLAAEAQARSRVAPTSSEVPVAPGILPGDPNPAVILAQRAVQAKVEASTPFEDYDALGTVRLTRDLSRAAIVMGLELCQASMHLVEQVKVQLARQMVMGEIELPAAIKTLRSISEVVKNMGGVARQAIESEVDLLGEDPSKGEDGADDMTDAEARVTIERAMQLLDRGKKRKKLAKVLPLNRAPKEPSG